MTVLEVVYLALVWTSLSWLAGYFMGFAVGEKKRQ